MSRKSSIKKSNTPASRAFAAQSATVMQSLAPQSLAPGRNPLPVNTGENLESDTSGVPSISPTKKIPIYPAVVRVGGAPWNFSGLDRETFGSPYSKHIRGGVISTDVRNQMDIHPKISQSFHNLKNGIIGEGGRCIPCVPPSHKDFDAARMVAEFCDFCLRHQAGNHHETASQMLDCIRDGNKVADISLKETLIGSGRFKGKRALDALLVFPEKTYKFYRDEFGLTTHLQVFNGNNTQADYVPRAKFWVATWRKRNNDPNGYSSYLAAYRDFFKDVHTDSEEMAYVSQVGRPSVVILAAPPPEAGLEEESFPLKDVNGNYLYEANPEYNPLEETTPTPLTPDDVSLNPLEIIRYGYMVEQNAILFTEFKAGSVWSLEAGSMVEVKQATPGGADLFRLMREGQARNMVGAIYGTHQVTENEGSLNTQNQDIAEGVAGLTVQYGKLLLERTEEDDILRLLVLHNFGESWIDLLPIRDYGSGMNSRLPKVFNSIVGMLSNGAMNRDQWWWFCAGNGLPLPYPESEPVVVAMRGTGGGDKTGVDTNNSNSNNNNTS